MQHGALRFGEVRDLTDGSSWGGGLPVSRKEEKATRRFQPPPPLPSFPIRLVSLSPAAFPSRLLAPAAAAASALHPQNYPIHHPRTLNKSSIGRARESTDGTAAGGSVADWRRSVRGGRGSAAGWRPLLEVRFLQVSFRFTIDSSVGVAG
jgi:hypothetical protein